MWWCGLLGCWWSYPWQHWSWWVMKRSHSILVMIQYRPAIIGVEGGVYILHEKARSRWWEEVQWTSNYMNALRHTCPLIHIRAGITTNHYRCASLSSYLSTMNELQPYRDVQSCLMPLFIWDMQQERELGESNLCVWRWWWEETCTTTNPDASILPKFIWYDSIDADDEAEGLEAPTLLHQSIEVDRLLCYSGSFSNL